MSVKAILGPLVISVAMLSVSPAFAARVIHRPPQTWFSNGFDESQPRANEPPPQYDFCVSPPIEYEPSTEPPPGCPGDTGPYR